MRARLLIIDPDETAVAHLLAIFERACWKPVIGSRNGQSDVAPSPDGIQRCACGKTKRENACAVVIDSLTQLHAVNLDHSDVVICATTLADASGLDALAYIRGTRPELPVILTGGDSSMAIEAIRGGALDFLVANTLTDLNMLPLSVEKSLVHQRIQLENDRLHHDLKRSLRELAVTNQQLQTVIRQLEAMARTDELTGLANRRWFNLMLQGSWAEATRNNLPLACMMIDLDGFKMVNDKMGHHHGDEMLRQAARVIRANCREIDVPSRYGGDEFCILMAHTEAHQAAMVADRILREFEHALRNRSEDQPPAGMSIGLSHIDLSRPITADQLVSHADEAMYAAKAAGKKRMMIRSGDGTYLAMWRG